MDIWLLILCILLISVLTYYILKNDNKPTPNSLPQNIAPFTNIKFNESKPYSNPWDIDFNSSLDPNSYWGKIRAQVFIKYENKCAKCGISRNLTVNHIIARRIGGTNKLNNLELLCKDCHEAIHKRSIYNDLQSFEGIDEYGKNSNISHKISRIISSIKSSRPITIDYINSNREKTHRTIVPQNLFIEHERIYLRAHCFLRNAGRTFRVARISLA